MSSRKRHEGYILVDHSASPGLPEDIARQSGFDPEHCREGKRFEAASLTCSHCKVAVVKNPLRVRERAYCQKCDHYICDLCNATTLQAGYSHFPYDKFVDLTMNGQLVTIPTLGSPTELLRESK